MKTKNGCMFLILMLLGLLPQGCAPTRLTSTTSAMTVTQPPTPENIDFTKFVTPKLHVTVQLDGLEIKTNSPMKKQQKLHLILLAAYNEQKTGTKGQTYQNLVPQTIDKDFIDVLVSSSSATSTTTTHPIPNIVLFDDYWQMESTDLRFKILKWNEISPSARNRLNAFLSNSESTGKLILDSGFVNAAASTAAWELIPIINSLVDFGAWAYNSISANEMLSTGWYSLVLSHNFAYRPDNNDIYAPLVIKAYDEQGNEITVVPGHVEGDNKFNSLRYTFITKYPVGQTKDRIEIRIMLSIKVERVQNIPVSAATTTAS